MFAAVSLLVANLQPANAIELRLANGVRIRASRDWTKEPVLECTRDRKTVSLSLSEFAKERVAADPVAGPAPASAAAVYSVQWVATGPSRAIGIIGYARPGPPEPSFDSRHELVLLETRNEPRLTRVRELEATREPSPAGPRLFWSQGELLLRNAENYEALDLTTGLPRHTLPVPGSRFLIGRMGPRLYTTWGSAWDTSRREVIVFDLERRLRTSFRVPTELRDHWPDYRVRADGNLEVRMSGYLPIEKPVRAEIRYVIDPLDGRVLRKHTVRKD